MNKRLLPVFKRVSAGVNGTSVTLAKVELSSTILTPMRSLDAPPSSTRLGYAPPAGGYRPSARQMEVTNG